MPWQKEFGFWTRCIYLINKLSFVWQACLNKSIGKHLTMSATETTVIFAKLEALKDIKYIYEFAYTKSFFKDDEMF